MTSFPFNKKPAHISYFFKIHFMQHDDCYNIRSPNRIHTDERTQVHSVQSSLTVIQILTEVDVP